MNHIDEEVLQSKPEKVKKPKRKKPRVWLVSFWVCFSLLFLMLVVAVSGLYYVWNQLGPTKAGEPVEVTITKGMSANSVSKLLEEKGIIKNSFIFGYYLVLKDEGANFQAGKYELTPGMDKVEVIAKLNAGDVIAEDTIMFTIPEGFTIEQIAEKLAAEGLGDRDTFVALANEDRTWSGAETVLLMPKEAANVKYRLEGYLFPDTYEFAKGITEEELILRLLKEQDRKLASLPEDWVDQLDKLGITMHEMLTIASLIEREVVVDEERAKVAGVIYNRLAEPMRLQIDATIQYALGEQKEVLSYEDTELDSPYNTYRIDGLPPGPIANPSLDSIRAALYPEEHDYLFYVTKKDGTNTHLFAKTYREHQQNIEKSKQTAE
ncbi:hypothetical protein J40TS1_24960 [Paenibacillus montaniterrae]|uniref:Endolytic murein transglycosylase n=1 Tax=Paenibacillus montaniterrae TaxID=429341 RepID=A0A920CZB6_9BACL|nr:endolytic transglycosylase MltG [Paenibacillus montaniterrae]GIP16854.1 hypothetical protein J40TS1_24960 [Paenibacillus montaniterrae]